MLREKRFLPNSEAGGIRLQKRADGDTELIPAITGTAAVFFNDKDRENTQYRLWDNRYERIMPGAFDRAIAEDDVRALKNHDVGSLLGRSTANTLTLSLTATGLDYEIDTPDTVVGRDTVTEVKRGDLDGSSFSFIATKRSWVEEVDDDDRVTYFRQVEEVRLFDVGPVTFPAYTGTTTGTRSPSCFFNVGERDGEQADAEARELLKELQEHLGGKAATRFANEAARRQRFLLMS